MSCKDSSARWKSVTDNTPYSLSKPEISSVANLDLGSGIRAQGPFWPLDSGSGIQNQDPGWVKSQDPDPGSSSGMENLDHISESWETFFLGLNTEILWCASGIQDPGWKKFGSGIRDGKNLDPGSGIRDEKNSDPGYGIWDQHPGSVKLEISPPILLGLKEPSNNRTICGKGILGWDQVIFTI